MQREPHKVRAYARGENLHTLTARQIFGRQQVSKADRQLARAVNFGLWILIMASSHQAYLK